MDRGSVNAVVGGGAAEAALPPLAGRGGQSAAPPPPTPTLGEGQRSESNAEFLGRQAAAEVTGGPRQTFARFVVDRETHKVSVEIIDAASNEVVRSIPNEELRRMAQRFSATQGVLLDSAI